jgi:hypothetical protein
LNDPAATGHRHGNPGRGSHVFIDEYRLEEDMRQIVGMAALVALLTPSAAAAQDAPAGPAETEVTLDLDTHVAGSVGVAGPLGFAAGFQLLHGLGADVREDGERVKAVCAVPIPHCAQGFLFQLDAGSGGGKLSLGVGARARVEEDDFNGTVGVGVRAAFVRTWGHPIGTEPNLNYLGPELDLAIRRLNVTLGVLWRVSGTGGHSALFSWGVGVVL